MEAFVKMPEELRKDVLSRVIEDLKEEAEGVAVEAVRREVEIDDMMQFPYPVNTIIRGYTREAREFIKSDAEVEVILKITRKNLYWKEFIKGCVESEEIGERDLSDLSRRFWSKRYISNRNGVITNMVIEEREIDFIVFRNFCYFASGGILRKEESLWPGNYPGLLILQLIAKRGVLEEGYWYQTDGGFIPSGFPPERVYEPGEILVQEEGKRVVVKGVDPTLINEG